MRAGFIMKVGFSMDARTRPFNLKARTFIVKGTAPAEVPPSKETENLTLYADCK